MSQSNTKINLKVIGIGGFGVETLKSIGSQVKSIKNDISIAALNTDVQSLRDINVDTVIQIGTIGAGGDPEKGYSDASDNRAAIEDYLSGADMVVIVAGLGKGTGSGAGLYVSELCKELGIYSVALLRLPELLDSQYRVNLANEYLEKIKANVQGYLTISNEVVLERALESNIGSIEDAYNLGNTYYQDTLISVISLIDFEGFRNGDIADFKKTVRGRFTVQTFLTENGDVTPEFGLYEVDSLESTTSMVAIATPTKGADAVGQLRAALTAKRNLLSHLSENNQGLAVNLTNPTLESGIQVIFITSGYDKTLSQIRSEAGRIGGQASKSKQIEYSTIFEQANLSKIN